MQRFSGENEDPQETPFTFTEKLKILIYQDKNTAPFAVSVI